MSERTWKYEAKIVRVIDGDTIICDIDQGMNDWDMGQYVRLAAINAPEKVGATKDAGLAAKAHLETLCPVGVKVWLVTVAYHEHEKYGRVLARVYREEPYSVATEGIRSVNEQMVADGHAVSM